MKEKRKVMYSKTKHDFFYKRAHTCTAGALAPLIIKRFH
jgi:hypothetical protein